MGMTEVMNSVKLGERKNCNLPGVKVDLPVLQEKDKDDLQKFGIPQGVDFVAASFVQSAEDVESIRKTLGLRGRSIKIISKIEMRGWHQESDGFPEEDPPAREVRIAGGDWKWDQEPSPEDWRSEPRSKQGSPIR